MSTETVAAPVNGSEERAWVPSSRGWAIRLIVLIALFLGVMLVTGIVPPYWADRISLAAVWAIIGLSLNVILGYMGQVSLGHQGFIGIAAFVGAYYATEQAGCKVVGAKGECSLGAFAAATFFAVLSGAITAGLLGLVALRIKGLYLALITLAYGFMAERSIFEISGLTRGGAGMPAPRPSGFTGDTAFAYLCFVVLALVLFIDWRMMKSKAGRAILSIKHSEAVAASYGINVTAYKVLAFVVSGVFAGLAGSLLAFHNQNVVSNDFQFQIALLWVLMVVVGGLGNRTGVVIGSAFFALFPFLIELATPVEHFLSSTLHREAAELAPVIGAMLAILTIIQYPGGIGQQISPITRWLRGQRFSMHPEGETGHAKRPKLRKSRGESKAEATATDGAGGSAETEREPVPAGVTEGAPADPAETSTETPEG